MKLTEEQIQKIFEEAKPSIINGLRDEIIQQARWEINPTVGKMVNDEVVEFMKAEILPEIKNTLIENKQGLLSVAISAAQEVSLELAKALTDGLKKKLESSWEREKIFGALFK